MSFDFHEMERDVAEWIRGECSIFRCKKRAAAHRPPLGFHAILDYNTDNKKVPLGFNLLSVQMKRIRQLSIRTSNFAGKFRLQSRWQPDHFEFTIPKNLYFIQIRFAPGSFEVATLLIYPS